MTPADTAHHAPAPVPAIDYDRVLRVILMIEGNPWTRPGGGYGFMLYSWREDTDMPYAAACEPHRAATVAKMRLIRFSGIAAKKGVPWTPILSFDAWRWGIDAALRRAKENRHSDYALRARNLYEDKTFP